jgi:hypothetical protein
MKWDYVNQAQAEVYKDHNKTRKNKVIRGIFIIRDSKRNPGSSLRNSLIQYLSTLILNLKKYEKHN